MSHTTPTDFSVYGPPTINAKKVEILNQWYQEFLGDADKADDINNHEYYMGNVDAFSDALTLIHGNEYDDPAKKDHTKRNVALVFVAGAVVGFALNSPAVGNFAKNLRFRFDEWRFGRRPVK